MLVQRVARFAGPLASGTPMVGAARGRVTVWCFRPPLALGSGKVGHGPPQGSVPSRLSGFPGRPSCISPVRRSAPALSVRCMYTRRLALPPPCAQAPLSSFPAAAVDVSYPYEYRVPPFSFRAHRLPSFLLVIHRLPTLQVCPFSLAGVTATSV